MVVHSLGNFLGGMAQVDPFQRYQNIQDHRTQMQQQEELFNLQRAMQELNLEQAQFEFDRLQSPEHSFFEAWERGFRPMEDTTGIDTDRYRLTEHPVMEDWFHKEARPGWEDPREHMARALAGEAVPLDPADVKQYEQEGLVVVEDPYAEGMYHVTFPPGYVDPASLIEGGWRQYTEDYMRRMQEAGEAIYHPHPYKDDWWLEERLGPTPEEQLGIMADMGYQPITESEASFLQDQGYHIEWAGFDYEGVPFGRVMQPLGPSPEQQRKHDLDLFTNYNIISPDLATMFDEDQLVPLEGLFEGYFMPILTTEMESQMGMDSLFDDPEALVRQLTSEGVPRVTAAALVATEDMPTILRYLQRYADDPSAAVGVGDDAALRPAYPGAQPFPGTLGAGYQETPYFYFDEHGYWPVVSRVEEIAAPGTALGTQNVERHYAIDPEGNLYLIPQDRVFEQTPDGEWRPVGYQEPAPEEPVDETGFWRGLWEGWKDTAGQHLQSVYGTTGPIQPTDQTVTPDLLLDTERGIEMPGTTAPSPIGPQADIRTQRLPEREEPVTEDGRLSDDYYRDFGRHIIDEARKMGLTDEEIIEMVQDPEALDPQAVDVERVIRTVKELLGIREGPAYSPHR